MEAASSIDLSRELKDEHQEKWIAYSPEESKIYAYSSDLQDLLKKVLDIDKKGLSIQWVLRFDASFIA